MKIVRNFKSALIFCFCCIIISSSCEKRSDNVKIALMLGNLRIARFQKDKEYFLSESKRLGCEGIVVDADNDEALQFKQAQDLIDQGYKTLVIAAVNSTTGAAIVRLANKNKVKTIGYDGIIENCPLDFIISFNDKKIGTLMAENAVSKATNGNYIIIGGDRANANSILIRNGEEEILSSYTKDGRIKICYGSYTEGWNKEDAYMTMKNYLRLSGGDKPVAVLAANDNMADGVIQAFEEEGIPIPIVTGQDASLIGCQNVMMGKQSVTVYKPIKKLAAMAAEVALKAAKGEKIEGNAVTFNRLIDVPTIFVDIIAVSKDNMESTVIADGFQKREEVMK